MQPLPVGDGQALHHPNQCAFTDAQSTPSSELGCRHMVASDTMPLPSSGADGHTVMHNNS